MADISELNVGDEVQIREYDDMKREFGDYDGCIACGSALFIPGMKEICGTKFIISHISTLYKDIIEGHNTSWTITAGMVDLVDVSFFEETDSLSQFLNNIKITREE